MNSNVHVKTQEVVSCVSFCRFASRFMVL